MGKKHVELIRRNDYDGLRDLWSRVCQGETVPGWPPGLAFEHLLLRAFELEGATVVWPYQVRHEGSRRPIEQIDGAVYVDGLGCLFEAKDHDNDVSFEPIAKLRSQLLRRPPAVIGIVFSRKGFTPAAKVLTRYMMPQTVLLWEGAEIAYALEREGMRATLRAKYRYAVEHGLPDYAPREGDIP
jgi:hypothetical protein